MLASATVQAQQAHSLTVGEGFVDPMGFYDATPSFSWKLPVGVKGQTAYRIEANTDGAQWDSGWVQSSQSTLVPYGGDPIGSRQRMQWRVNFRDEKGKDAGFSQWAHFEMGLLVNEDWLAKWVRPEVKSERKEEPVAQLRCSFTVDQPIALARLYVTARGVFSVELNGQRVGDDHFANGWTSYNKHLDTLTYDVADQLADGGNILEVMLGKGWYAGRLFNGPNFGLFGEDPALLLQLEITFADGSTKRIISDESWEGTWQGPVVSSSIYDGEVYDARRATGGWRPVAVDADLGPARLTPKSFPTVRVTQTLEAKAITEPEPGRYVFDLGQNMVGWAKIHIPVVKDQTVTLRFAEILDTDGTMYTENLRSAKCIDTYTSAETGTIQWEPNFTFHGFRYVELSGLPKGIEPKLDWVVGKVLHTDLKRIGYFESSHAKLNQLQSNIVWGQRGNFLDIPTDCPQRDERLGWTGDAQVFCPTSMFNYDCHAFWKSWLRSVRVDQLPDGSIPHVIPNVIPGDGSTGWVDAATMIPWEVYVRTGDTEVLTENLPMMEKLIGWYRSESVDGLIPKTKAFGDWLQPYAKKTEGDTPHELLATAFYAHSTRVLADACRVLGREADAKRYDDEANAVKAAFAKHYFDADGKLQNANETQTAYLLAIAFELIPQELVSKAATRLVRLVDEADGHLRTGFLGTPYIVSMLDRTGHTELACQVLLKETYPSWFYSINQGATTMWERWNSYSHEDGFGKASMNSFNHYAYGAIGQWMYERVAGLTPDPAQPGYKHFFVRPLVSIPLEHARAELETPYGQAVSAWIKNNGQVTLNIVVPPNTTATVVFPDGRQPETVEAGTHRYKLATE